MNKSLPVGFTLWFTTSEEMKELHELIRAGEKVKEIRELCPSNNHWNYKAENESGQRLIDTLASAFKQNVQPDFYWGEEA